MPHLPLPPHHDPARAGQVWPVPYNEIAASAREWARSHGIAAAASDTVRTLLMPVDMQNTFCLPEFELFVAGRSGNGAVDDIRRLCSFIYRNLDVITTIAPTMDTHQAIQIFHPIFWVDAAGEHPSPYTLISAEDVEMGRWRVNPEVAPPLEIDLPRLERIARHYVQNLRAAGKFDLTIWPYHAMLGGIGHALVSSLEEAVFFHAQARVSAPNYQIKGGNPLTENYSVLSPEVLIGPDGEHLGTENTTFIRDLLAYDAIIIAGEAKSHCVAWTIADLLTQIRSLDPSLARKVYLLEDCASPVVIPRVIDYTEAADDAYRTFAAAGMHLVRSTDPIDTWPGFPRPYLPSHP